MDFKRFQILNNINIGVLILAGGKSKRMGSPKPWLTANNGVTFVEQIATSYLSVGIKPITMVLSSELANDWQLRDFQKRLPQVRIIMNRFTKLGKGYSLFLGLKDLQNEDFVFIHPVDCPCVNHHTVLEIKKQTARQNFDVFIPSYKGKSGHPVLVKNNVLKYILSQNPGKIHLKRCLLKHQVAYVVVNEHQVLDNINTISEYQLSFPEEISFNSLAT